MRTFSGWRMAGRAMRWARQQEGYGKSIRPRSFGAHHVWGRRTDGQTFEVRITWGINVEFHARGPIRFAIEEPADAEVILRVLAALRLIPDELAVPLSTTCVTCGRDLVPSPLKAAKWSHLDHDAWLKNMHRAEVAQ